MRTLLLGCALALAFATTPARGQESPFKFEFHGFVTGSLYYQQQAFVNGQGQALLLERAIVFFDEHLQRLK